MSDAAPMPPAITEGPVVVFIGPPHLEAWLPALRRGALTAMNFAGLPVDEPVELSILVQGRAGPKVSARIVKEAEGQIDLEVGVDPSILSALEGLAGVAAREQKADVPLTRAEALRRAAASGETPAARAGRASTPRRPRNAPRRRPSQAGPGASAERAPRAKPSEQPAKPRRSSRPPVQSETPARRERPAPPPRRGKPAPAPRGTPVAAPRRGTPAPRPQRETPPPAARPAAPAAAKEPTRPEPAPAPQRSGPNDDLWDLVGGDKFRTHGVAPEPEGDAAEPKGEGGPPPRPPSERRSAKDIRGLAVGSSAAPAARRRADGPGQSAERRGPLDSVERPSGARRGRASDSGERASGRSARRPSDSVERRRSAQRASDSVERPRAEPARPERVAAPSPSPSGETSEEAPKRGLRGLLRRMGGKRDEAEGEATESSESAPKPPAPKPPAPKPPAPKPPAPKPPAPKPPAQPSEARPAARLAPAPTPAPGGRYKIRRSSLGEGLHELESAAFPEDESD